MDNTIIILIAVLTTLCVVITIYEMYRSREHWRIRFQHLEEEQLRRNKAHRVEQQRQQHRKKIDALTNEEVVEAFTEMVNGLNEQEK